MAAAVVRAVLNYQKLTAPPHPVNLPPSTRPLARKPPVKSSP
jgi:hypothetical protein